VEESSAPLEFCCEVPLVISQSKKRNGLHNRQSEKISVNFVLGGGGGEGGGELLEISFLPVFKT